MCSSSNIVCVSASLLVVDLALCDVALGVPLTLPCVGDPSGQALQDGGSYMQTSCLAQVFDRNPTHPLLNFNCL